MKLKIAVLVKQVPDHEAIVRVKSEQELDIENRYVCSFFDCYWFFHFAFFLCLISIRVYCLLLFMYPLSNLPFQLGLINSGNRPSLTL